MDFPSRLKEIRNTVWEEIRSYLPKCKDEYSRLIWEYPKRQGKYLRPGLIVLSAEMYGGLQKEALLTAAAIQMSEEWLLIHDDFEDHSEERRSTKEEKRLTLSKICGDEIAVNTGDALHTIMWKVAGDIAQGFKDQRGWDIFNKLNEIILITTKGQFEELLWIRNKRIDISEKEYLEMIYKKTACYTIIGPLQLGAIIAGVKSSEELNKIERWGKWLGYGFQITDDVINLTSEEAKQGKEMGGDILEGKRTMILIHLLQHCDSKEKGQIHEIYNKPRKDKTESEKKYVIDLMNKYGSINYSKKKAEKYFQKAQEIFDKNTINLPGQEAKELIKECMVFIKNRVG
jgi:geranylgeranyl diphosphate synthase type II